MALRPKLSMFNFGTLHTRKHPTKIMSGDCQNIKNFDIRINRNLKVRDGFEYHDEIGSSAYFVGLAFFNNEAQDCGFFVGLCSDGKYRWGDAPCS